MSGFDLFKFLNMKEVTNLFLSIPETDPPLHTIHGVCLHIPSAPHKI